MTQSNKNEKQGISQNTIGVALISLLLGGGGGSVASNFLPSSCDKSENNKNMAIIVTKLEMIQKNIDEIKIDNKETKKTMSVVIQSNKAEINKLKWEVEGITHARK